MRMFELRQAAEDFGALAITDIAYDDVHLAYVDARDAAHYANLYFECERVRDAPTQAIFDSKAATMQRLARTPRCNFRNVTTSKCAKTGTETSQIGDPCGGKLKAMKHAGVLVGVECRACGRSERFAKESQEKNEEKEAA